MPHGHRQRHPHTIKAIIKLVNCRPLKKNARINSQLFPLNCTAESYHDNHWKRDGSRVTASGTRQPPAQVGRASQPADTLVGTRDIHHRDRDESAVPRNTCVTILATTPKDEMEPDPHALRKSPQSGDELEGPASRESPTPTLRARGYNNKNTLCNSKSTS